MPIIFIFQLHIQLIYSNFTTVTDLQAITTKNSRMILF